AVADRNDLPHQKQANAPAASRTPGAGGESGAVGAGRAGGVASAEAAGKGADPLFDLRPVWMASPETVAQIFPRQAIFDVVIFDEASQCRLEEALPVLARARRVVIAGDPKQLPPTRFFESAVASSDDEEIETDEQLFEVQQGEIEDLLGAALNIEIDECYLDVHYRSRNADLIQFSNQHFYGARLQAIPGHPANRTRYAPLTLYRVKGVYEKRCNRAEAEQVGKIIRDLFKRAEAPSIGVACFNLQQRDLIVEHLEELAAEDAEFAGRLAEARTRRGPASFEGLFVKNLENVQGDERDHMIISTTYGPDVKGKFYRRFGPLGRSGGGRRLNVLVTRAREEVHLVTSIPAEVYRALPPVPKGQTPTGGYLLFAYLNYAEKLAEAYETAHEVLEEARGEARATVNVRPARWPSEFAQALAEQLCGERQVGSDVHWGNDGFCVDLALHHPKNAEDVTIGVLCDATRFAQAQDPVEWEIFRTGILEGQGWKLHRVWTPHFFRDPRGGIDAIVKDVNEVLANEEEKDAIRVERIHRGGAKDAE
ncbi:MAG TPA: AAA domain-containing protein, partial [Tepidisphaeraceae bacterium]